jgi:hypothetical protein
MKRELTIVAAVVLLYSSGIMTGAAIVESKYNNIDTCNVEQTEQTYNIDTLTLNEENFIKVCQFYNVRFPEVILAQAKLESGYFNSNIFRTRNNMLGLYDSRNKCFYQFSHWTYCIAGYRDLVQYKYVGGDDIEEYCTWLTELPYAADEQYICKVKSIMNK